MSKVNLANKDLGDTVLTLFMGIDIGGGTDTPVANLFNGISPRATPSIDAAPQIAVGNK